MREASNNLSIFYNLKIQGIYFEKSVFSNNLHKLPEFWPLSAPLNVVCEFLSQNIPKSGNEIGSKLRGANSLRAFKTYFQPNVTYLERSLSSLWLN